MLFITGHSETSAHTGRGNPLHNIGHSEVASATVGIPLDGANAYKMGIAASGYALLAMTVKGVILSLRSRRKNPLHNIGHSEVASATVGIPLDGANAYKMGIAASGYALLAMTVIGVILSLRSRRENPLNIIRGSHISPSTPDSYLKSTFLFVSDSSL